MVKNSINNLSIGFLQSSRKFPEREALVVDNFVFTYRQLSQMAALFKKVICTSRVKDEKLIGVFAYRKPAAYAGVLAILASGCGYVPLNPELPTERSLKALNLSRISTVIVSLECKSAFDELLKSIKIKMLFVLVGMDVNSYINEYPMHHFIGIDDLSSGKEELEIEPVSKDDIAYLLFTSGSTGDPKGVPVSHHNVRSYVEFITGRYDINEHDRCSQMHDMTFDFSIHDIYPTWEKGACLCVASKQDKLLPVNYIQRNKISLWACVPSIVVLIEKYGRLQPNIFPDIRLTFFCGEALYATVAEKWQSAASASKIVNLYGPTETTMAISYYEWDQTISLSQSINGIVPIGHIFAGQKARVILDNGQIAKEGEVGELCLSGSQVTKGYWNNPNQTAAQYVHFADTGDTLWYKTGDLVQKDIQGCFYYMGRVDNQIKVLGNRVELGEIEKILREASGVELAVCIPWPVNQGNADGLIAFVCESKTSDKQILEYCREKLPKYMVPTAIYFIKDMPMNNNGKIDRLQLKELMKVGLQEQNA
jgi:amino acid adenylation domain-containing protein